ncbi:MAG: hypothetical protein F9K29_00565 [Hyphomicrobiaceae bacterium]|nr:MAG: hypothetical protein F9K29_00565 [Hyphomicrobiaceae bacterium]
MSKPLVNQISARARALVGDPATWTQYTLALTRNNRDCDPTDPRAARFCAYGALVRAAFELTADRDKARTLAGEAAMAMTGRETPEEAYEELYAINDGPRRSSRIAIMSLFDASLQRV